MQRSEHAVGVILIILSALAFSTTGLFTKSVEATAWEILFWRGVATTFFVFIFLWYKGTLRLEFPGMGRSGILAATVSAVATAVFIPALKLTTIANVALIYAAAPLLAALIAFVWMGERLRYSVAIGCALAMLGVAIIVWGSVGGGNLNGDFLAVIMTILMALLMVIYRRFPNTPSAGPMALSALFLVPFGFWLGIPLNNSIKEVGVIMAFGAVFAFAAITLMEGAKRLPSAETALLSTLESLFAPLFAFLLLAETPELATYVGGALILISAVTSQWSKLGRN